MSSQSNTYVMVGVKLTHDTLSEEQLYGEFEPYMDSAFEGIHHHNGLCMIADGMGGRYIFIGRVLAKSDDQNGNYGLNKPLDLDEASTIKLRLEVENLIAEQFTIEEPDVRDWVFTHYR